MYTAQLVSAVEFNTNHFIVKAVTTPDEAKSMALLVRRLAQLPPVNKGSSTGFFTAVKTTVNQAVASVTALATDSAPRPSPAAGSHHAGVYSENTSTM